jgi:CRISPR-associated protein (TIGR03984 family)
MKRDIKDVQATVYALQVKCQDVVAWMEQRVQAFHWLLAHSETGVTWGEVRNGRLVTPKTGAPKLETSTLWQARLFGLHLEMLVWRDGDGLFKARVITDQPVAASEDERLLANYRLAFDEPQMLWGDTAAQVDEGFTAMSDGAEGLVHIVPFASVDTRPDDRSSQRPLRLMVRHYVDVDEAGFHRIAASRLTDLNDDNANH